MVNSGDDESDNLIMPRAQVRASSWLFPGAARIAWDEIDFTTCNEERLEVEEKKSKLKTLLRCVGIGK